MHGFRIYHLLFAAGVACAWLTAEELGLIHAWTGYIVAALLMTRLALAALGARGFDLRRIMPRFSATSGLNGGIRHPAIGQMLTLALLLAVGGVAGTGIAMDKGGTLIGQSIRAGHGGDEEGGGDEEDDLAASQSPGSMLGLITPARADDGGEIEDDEHGLLGEVHETLGNLLLPLVAIHAAWLLLFRWQLARFMLFMPRRQRL